jgi:hypothetical protein
MESEFPFFELFQGSQGFNGKTAHRVSGDDFYEQSLNYSFAFWLRPSKKSVASAKSSSGKTEYVILTK